MIQQSQSDDQQIQITPEHITFLGVLPGTKKRRAICVTNHGPEPVRVGLRLHPSRVFSFHAADIVSVKSGQMAIFEVTFSPAELKHYLDYVEIEINRCRVIRVTLEGYPVLSPRVSPVLSFANARLHEVSKKCFTVRNTSNLDFLYLVKISNESCESNIRIFPLGTMPLPANSALKFTVYYCPSTLTTETAYVSFTALWNQLAGPTRGMTVSGNSSFRRRLTVPTNRIYAVENDQSPTIHHHVTSLNRKRKALPNPITDYQRKKQTAETVARRRKSWTARHELEVRTKNELKLVHKLGFQHVADMPTEQRKTILRIMVAAADKALLHPDNGAAHKLLELANGQTNLNLPPKLGVLLNPTPSAPVSVEVLPATESKFNLPSSPVTEFIVNFMDNALKRGLTVDTICQLFPQLAQILLPIEKLVIELRTPAADAVTVDQPTTTLSKITIPHHEGSRLSPTSPSESNNRQGRGPSASRNRPI